jgi:CBS domain-containing protein
MFVSQICKREVVSVMRQTSVVEAARLMREHHVGDVVVLESREGRACPAGILTDRDIVILGVAQLPNELACLQVGALMTPTPVTVWEGDTLEVAIATLCGHGVRRLPVISQKGDLVGVVSAQDILERLTINLSSLVSHCQAQHRAEEQRHP